MLLRSPLLQAAGFAAAFPEAGVPDEALRDAVGGGAIVQVKQVHGGVAVRASDAVRARAAGAPLEADALVARAADRVAVGVRVADCVPVLVADPRTGDVAAIHAGWRGVVAGVIGAAVRRLADQEDGEAQEAQEDGENEGRGALVAAIGPCIGACCFEVGPEVGEQLGFVVRRTSTPAGAGDKAYVDLRAAVRAQLAALGVTQVDDVPGCTKHEARFHSFRRDGANSGRMLAAIAARGRG